MKKINHKIVFFGIVGFCINTFVFLEKLSNDNYRYYSAARASLMDGYFGFFLLLIFFILSISLVSYGFGLNIKISNLGKYIVDLFLKIYGKKKE